ncbi:hypothetical protein HID58_024598 [Brassica napus]|uniref:RPM1 interacting protein 13 n=1 Tax=Brassica napus TaxID=3708 RepID=A0ABQ8CIT5_BRANA|nr:CREB-regulated transcription coactivator 1 [Brassica napus]KAH0916938.1 hypothetical protein HID58_024598 [Brassica napus]
MGSGNHEVVDVSSDEEEEVDTRVDEDFDWLNDLSSDSTDVVEVLSEMKGSVDSLYRKPKALEDDDDDCVILDGDPDKTTKTDTDDKLAKDDDDDDDEVLVVGQKGEIACRDFPHPRHSCAKYFFNSTSHEKYCDMCHCYVCDIPAPCAYWCIAVSSIDHCHANDKEKIWRNQREFFRTGTMPTEPSPKPLPASPTVTRQIPPSPIPNIIRLSQNPLPGSMIGIRPCSSSSRVAANLSNVSARQRSPHNHGLQSLIGGRSNIIRKDRSSYSGANLRSRMASSGTRYSGNSVRVGLHTNGKVSQSTHHIPSVVAPPTITAEMYAQQQQQRSRQLNVPDYRAAVTGSQSNLYTQHSVQSKSVGQFQANAGLFAPPEPPLTTGGLQAQTVQQQPPGSNDNNVLQTKLSEVESWLMDSSNQVGLVSPLPEPVGEDNVSPLTFDFENFLND